MFEIDNPALLMFLAAFARTVLFVVLSLILLWGVVDVKRHGYSYLRIPRQSLYFLTLMVLYYAFQISPFADNIITAEELVFVQLAQVAFFTSVLWRRVFLALKAGWIEDGRGYERRMT